VGSRAPARSRAGILRLQHLDRAMAKRNAGARIRRRQRIERKQFVARALPLGDVLQQSQQAVDAARRRHEQIACRIGDGVPLPLGQRRLAFVSRRAGCGGVGVFLELNPERVRGAMASYSGQNRIGFPRRAPGLCHFFRPFQVQLRRFRTLLLAQF
jgi:hypothetical protein